MYFRFNFKFKFGTNYFGVILPSKSVTKIKVKEIIFKNKYLRNTTILLFGFFKSFAVYNNLYDFFMIFDQFVSYVINIFVRQQIWIVRLFRLFCCVSQFMLQIFYTQLSQFSPFLRHMLFLTPQFIICFRISKG